MGKVQNELTKNKMRPSVVIKLSGSYCAFMIGAGYASGQEIMQYFTSYGFLWSTLGIVISLVLGAWTTGEVMDVGFDTNDVQGKKSYDALCGKYVGKFLSFFIPIFMFLTLVIMISGSGAAFDQHFGVNPWVGCGVLAVLTGVVVFFGLVRVVDTIGFIGPAIIAIAILVGIIVLIKNPLNVAEYDAFLETQEMYQAASSWWLSSVLYVLWGIVMGLPFMAAMGTRAQNKKEIVAGAIVGNVMFNVALILMTYAIASKLPAVFDQSIPALSLANEIHPVLGNIYAVILLAAMFTTAVPLMWGVVARIAPEKSKIYYISIIVIAVLGFFGGQLPFEMLINYVYPLIGWLGFLVLGAIIWRDIKKIKRYKEKAVERSE